MKSMLLITRNDFSRIVLNDTRMLIKNHSTTGGLSQRTAGCLREKTDLESTLKHNEIHFQI